MFKSIIAVVGITFAFPVLTFAADIPVGRVEYESHCMMCHGASGKGNGWLAGFLRQPIISLTQLKKNNSGVFPAAQVYQVIDGRTEIGLHGPRDMPVWGEVYFTRAQKELGPYGAHVDEEVVGSTIRALVDYISTLQE